MLSTSWQAGAPLEVVQQRFGYSTLQTTIIYLAETPDSETLAVSLINW